MAIEAALEFDFEADIDNAVKYLRAYQRKAIDPAVNRSLNKVGVTVRAESAREVKKYRRLKISEIKKGMRVVRARPGRPMFVIHVSRRPISLRRYGAKWGGGKRRRRVVVNIDGRRQKLEHAFIVQTLNGQVFERVGRSRLPIRKLLGPSLGTAVEKQAVRNKLGVVVRRRWPRVFTSELEYEIDKLRRRYASGR